MATVQKKQIQKNGLTPIQVERARDLLKQVNVSEICELKRIKISTIYNVLRDESPHVEQLKTVLIEAKKIIKKKAKTLTDFPV